MQKGLMVIGDFDNTASKPWQMNDGRSGVTHKIRISVGERETDYGEKEKTFLEIRVAANDWDNTLAAFAKLKGKQVQVPIYANAKAYDGREPFVQYQLQREANITAVDPKAA